MKRNKRKTSAQEPSFVLKIFKSLSKKPCSPLNFKTESFEFLSCRLTIKWATVTQKGG